MATYWNPELSKETAHAIKRWEFSQWKRDLPVKHLQWLIASTQKKKHPPAWWIETAEMAAAEIAWREVGRDTPFS
jgi:hypothetical protein